MAASVTSLGPPNIGPGNSAVSVGFAVSATSRRGVCTNREPLSGNTLCYKNNVERKHAIHESRLASVKTSLCLSTPRRMDFMDKRLSKNFHMRRHHAQVVRENLKILRALEEIHSRSSTAVGTGTNNSATGGRRVAASSSDGGKHSLGRSTSTPPLSVKKSKGMLSASNSNLGRSSSRKKLSSLLARKRDVKAALVARENQKMMERMTRSKSLYSREQMRQHRVRHQRVLRLRKTDYTAGHLLAAATASRHWAGGNSSDEGFAYSFEEGRHRHRLRTRNRNRNRHTQGLRKQALDGGGGRVIRSTSPSTGASRSVFRPSNMNRGSSYSPTRRHGGRDVRTGVVRGGNRETRSAPRLPSILNASDNHGESNILGSPNLEQCRLAAEMSGRSDPVGSGCGGGGGGSRASSSRNSVVESGNHEGESSRSRPSSDGGVGHKGGSRHNQKTSWQRGGKNTGNGANGSGGSSTCGIRGTESSSDSLSHRIGSVASSGEDSTGYGRGGHASCRRKKGGGGIRGEKGTGSSASGDNTGDEAEGDSILNPLTFLDETNGVRVLIQATKPLEILHSAGETWICFIRIMVKEPFDDHLDIRIIHDQEEVCRRVLSLQEANAICEYAKHPSDDEAFRDRICSLAPPLVTAQPVGDTASNATTDGMSAPYSSSSKATDAQSETSVKTDAPDPHGQLAAGLEQCAANDESLGDVLSTLFQAADTEKKGYLTPEQLTSIMQNAELGLTGPELHLVIAEADDNADGTIDYYEFIPLAYNLVNAFQARRRACKEMDETNLDLDQQAIHELYDVEFDRLVRQLKALCKSQDPHGKGVLPRAEFKQCISADRCGGLTKIESKLLLNILPKDSQGNIIYRKLAAGLEQVRFTTLRNTVAEASATDTQKYLMALCRQEDSKSDLLGSKGHLKTSGDTAVAIGGKHYSGMLRARQMTKLLLNAPLLSLSRLHVTALMSQAHIVDGMVNYVDLVPMIAKTIEGMFHPRSLKMRHEIFKNRAMVGGSGSSSSGGGGVEGGSPTPTPTSTVLGKSRDDIQRIFVDVLRNDKQGAGIERLKDPDTFTRCMESLGFNLEPDTISALWVAAALESRDGTTFVDVVDFCFNCVLFMEQEKEMKTIQQARNTATKGHRSSLAGRAAPGVATVARAEAVAAAALAGEGDARTGNVEPLLSLARALVRHAKVTASTEGNVGLEFPRDRQIRALENGGSSTPSDAASQSVGGMSGDGKQGVVSDERDFLLVSDASRVASLSSFDLDHMDAETSVVGGGVDEGERSTVKRDNGTNSGLQLRAGGPGATVLLRARRKIPIVGSSGQPTMTGSSPLFSTADAIAGNVAPSSGTHQTTRDGDPAMPSGRQRLKNGRQRKSLGHLETTEAAGGETWDMVIIVYWDGIVKDRVHVEAFPANRGNAGNEGAGGEGGRCKILRLGVRVPTLAIVDTEAASKFAERVVQQVSIHMQHERVGARGKKGAGQRQQSEPTLHLAGVDAKSVLTVN